MNDLIQNFAVYVLPILFAITLHEAAHAYAAKYFGDTTAYSQGRMSLNPVRHIDPVGTLLIPIALYFSGSPFLFGYAKPVPVEWSRLRNPKIDMAWVALAGPGANFVMALLWLLFSIALTSLHMSDPNDPSFPLLMAEAGIRTNLVIMAFNLFPIPPLDGGRVLTSILPRRYAYKFAQIEPYGFFIVLALVMIHQFHFWEIWMMPIMNAAGYLLINLVFPLKFLLN